MILPGSSFDSADKIGECRSSVFRNDVVISFHGRPNAIPIGGTIGISFIDQCGLGIPDFIGDIISVSQRIAYRRRIEKTVNEMFDEKLVTSA